MALAPGTTLGPYEILTLVGSGGMGEVYRARDTRLKRDVAITVIPVAYAADPDRLARFEQEAHTTAALSHPNILGVYDVGTHDGQPYVVSELLHGRTLRDALAEGIAGIEGHRLRAPGGVGPGGGSRERHYPHINKIGLVTDSALGDVAEHLASHFVSAEIRHFSAGNLSRKTLDHKSRMICRTRRSTRQVSRP